MLTAIKFDDSNILWFNWQTTNEKELDSLDVMHFDVFNVEYGEINEKALENFYVTYFECKKSLTGYCAIFTRKRCKH